MAIIQQAYAAGYTLYATIRNSSGQIWNGSTFENYNSLNWSTYDVALSEDGSSGYYKVTMPSVGAGKFSILVYRQKGGAPAESDAPPVGGSSFVWDGTTEEVGIKNLLDTYRLDELAYATAGAVPAQAGSLIDQMMNKNGSQTFDQSTDSLEALADSGGGGPTVGQIADAVWDEAIGSGVHDTAGTAGERLKAIDDKLPSGTISDFDETTDSVNLNSDQSGVTIGTVNALGTTAKSHVNAEVADVIGIDTIAELSSGTPSATPTLKTAIMYLYMAWRNKQTQENDEISIYNNAGVRIAKAAVSDNGVTFTKENYAAP